MQRNLTSVGQHKFKLLALLLLAASVQAQQPCAACHPKEVAGYAKTGMARSLAPIKDAALPPDASFEHAPSKTTFSIHTDVSGSSAPRMTQGLTRQDESIEQTAAFAVGSGNHAFGYLMQVGDHVFQSPLSYYTNKREWGVAPGYELDQHPDFARPVSAECLFCHSDKPLPIPDTLNRYQTGVFASYAVSCDRCHGDAAIHLKNPVPGSILNPAKLSGPARSSICEQCHLTGEIRIPNPDKSITDFKPGHELEEFYSTYIAAKVSGQSIKVVSHAEQLRLSKCAIKSGDRLWCGTCHNPHDQPTQPAAYFRDRCLTCHAATLDSAHGAPGRDCIACHMPKLPAVDGGHTAFTNHRIARSQEVFADVVEPDTLSAWRDPEPSLRDRNLALALVDVGLQDHSPAEVIRGYRMINQVKKDFPEDPAVLTSLGSVLMKGKQPAEALKCFQKVAILKPGYAPYYVNVASALLATNQPTAAAQELEKALAFDPLLEPAVEMLSKIFQDQGQAEKASQLLAHYDRAMHISHQ